MRSAVPHIRRLPSLARRWPRGTRGQGLTEFALVLPIIVFVLVAVFDVGRAVYSYNTLANAARQGARVAAVNQLDPPNSNTSCAETMPIEDQTNPRWSIRACTAASAISLGLLPADVTVSYSAPPSTTLSCSPTLHVGCIASVSVNYRWTPITPLIGNIIGPIDLSANSQIQIERVFP